MANAEAATKKPRRINRESPEVRRKSLIQATMRSIAKYGFMGATIEKICEEAQVSRGLINHHFNTKEELVLQAYKDLCDEWAFQTHAVLLEKLRDPEEKLKAMIRVSFGPSLFKQDYLSIFVGFWSIIGKSPALRKVHRDVYTQYRDSVEEIFHQIAAQRKKKVDARLAAITLNALIDGLWLQWCLDPTGFSAQEAEKSCLAFIDGSFS